MSMRFESGELLIEFGGCLTAVSENSPCKTDRLVGVLWTAFYVKFSECLEVLARAAFLGAGVHLQLSDFLVVFYNFFANNYVQRRVSII